MAKAPTIDVKFQVSEKSTVIVPLAELMRLATATAEMGRVLAERVQRLGEAREKVGEVMTQGRDEILRLQRELDEALAKRAEVERERDKALQALQEREVDLQNAIAGNMPLAELAVLAETHAKAKQERDEALAKLAEAERLFAVLRAEDAAKVRELTELRDRLREALERERISKANLMGIATRLSDALELDHVPVAAGEDLRELRAWLARARGHEVVAADRPD